ncbi:odorant receptor 13a-like isoform X2 [Megachile rotundata]|uniref:odorant receptor 13a-like isoform X2 n=1 Tax=Megachile rotundata TaxID=143995 RepID=UPI003FCF6E15
MVVMARDVDFSHQTWKRIETPFHIKIVRMIAIRYQITVYSMSIYHITQAQWCSQTKPPSSRVSFAQTLKSTSTMKSDNSISGPTSVEEDLNYTMRFVRLNLQMVGAWPLPNTSPIYSKILKTIPILVAYFLYFLVIVPGFLYMFLKTKSGQVRLKVFGPILNCCMQFIKYTILLLRSKQIRDCLDVIRQDWIEATEEDRSILHSRGMLGRKLILTVMLTLYGGGLCYRTIIPLMKGPITLPNNVTIRPMACAGYFVFINEQQTPTYEIVFTLQFFSGIITYATSSGSYGIFTVFVLHVCSLLRMLNKKMKSLDEGADLSERTVNYKIADIVEHERKIKGFFENVEAITQYICFVDIMGNTCLICLMGYRIITEPQKSDPMFITICIILQTSFIFCSFILCYIGQLLVDENNVVGMTSVMLDWYRLPIKKARCLVLIIAMSNYPMQLTAGKIVEISLVTFTDIMKMSMAYLNILREVV